MTERKDVDKLFGMLRLAYRDLYTDPNVGIDYPDYSYEIEQQIKDLIPFSKYPEPTLSESIIGLVMAISLLLIAQTFFIVLTEILK